MNDVISLRDALSRLPTARNSMTTTTPVPKSAGPPIPIRPPEPAPAHDPHCQICVGRMWIRMMGGDHPCPVWLEEQAAEMWARRRAFLRRMCGIPEPVLDSAAATHWPIQQPHPAMMMGKASAWMDLDDTPPWLLMIGPKGCGKTRLASWTVARLCRQVQPVLYLDATEWIMDRMETRSTDRYLPDGEPDPFSPPLVKWLVLDDVTAECWRTGPRAEALFALLTERYRTARRTFLLSNENPEEWQGAMAERLASRLEDNAMCHRVVLKGAPDYRVSGWPSS